MNRGRFAVLVGGGLLLQATAACAEDPRIDEQALQVVERTKTVDATYANYIWNRIAGSGEPPTEEWSAEFHSGSRHRVETPRERLIADCSALTGTAISLATGEKIVGASVAAAACGISTTKPFRSARLIGPVEGPSGPADRVEVNDRDYVRTYDVTREGILVRGIYASNEAPSTPTLESWTVALDRNLPSEDMFSEESLTRSFVPPKFTNPPESVR